VKYTPFRFRKFNDKYLFTNESGEYSFYSENTLDNILNDNYEDIHSVEKEKLLRQKILINSSDDWRLYSLANSVKNKINNRKKSINYIIIIPTLRCNLSCSYCQVSRAPLESKGFDWDEDKIIQFKNFLLSLDSEDIKIEFQGGEPTLRTDIILDILNFSKLNFKKYQIVICTNLLNITKEFEEIIGDENVYISTSIDGPIDIMTNNRTKSNKFSQKFFDNFNYVVKNYGLDKIAALPTITIDNFKNYKELIDTYHEIGFKSIFLRPVNYMGFARKKFKDSRDYNLEWEEFYFSSIDYIKEINHQSYFDESYLSLILRKIFSNKAENYVDFRSPNFCMHDYLVIDFDGKIYPSDESRMLSRIGHVDLEMGTLKDGLKIEKADEYNFFAMNEINQDCIHCPYMPFCGIEPVDDISRYGRIDYPKHDTVFCQRHMKIFDFIFSKIEQKEMDWLDLFHDWIYGSVTKEKSYEIFYDKTEI